MSRYSRLTGWLVILIVAKAILLFGFVGYSKPPVTLAASPPPGKPVGDVKAFFVTHCVKCHGPAKKEGGLDLTSLDPARAASGDRAAVWQAAVDRIRTGEMPPDGTKPPPPADADRVVAWIEAELTAAGKSGAVRAGSLRTGNHVPHESLFGPAATDAPLAAPPRVWRVSPFIYKSLTTALAGRRGPKVPVPFSFPAGDGFKDQAPAFGIDESTTAQLLSNADALASGQLSSKDVPEFAPLTRPAAANPAQVAAAVRRQFGLVLSRDPSPDEVKRFGDFYERLAETCSPPIAARKTLAAVILLPEANFRSERGSGPADARGLVRLTPREIAFALAYALTDKGPDADLLKAADAGRLSTRDGVAKEATRLLGQPQLDKPRVLRFFQEYFGYTSAAAIFKDPKTAPFHEPTALVDDTDRLVQWVLAKDQDVLRELLTTNRSFVAAGSAEGIIKERAKRQAQYEAELKRFESGGGKKKPKLAEFGRDVYSSYNLPGFPEAQPVELPRSQRAGILTQPSWLVATSENDDNHAIRRGKWVRERLLGLTVPDLPITVDAQLPNAPHKTLRQRMEVTREAYCWQCHQKMNPPGLAFEAYDHLGRFRTTEQVEVYPQAKDPKGKPVVAHRQAPVDSTGLLERTGDPALDKKYADAVEMAHALAKSDRVRQVFVRHAFRYWAGREETLGDGPSLRAADAAYVSSGGSMKALLVALLSSDSFLYRSAAVK